MTLNPATRTLGLAALAAAGLAAGAALIIQRGPDPVDAADLVLVGQAADTGTPLYMQRHEVTVAEWNRCNDAGACSLRLSRPRGAGDASYPATGLSYVDVSEYIDWVNRNARRTYRLPTAQEWYAAAHEVLPETPDPIFTDPNLTWASAYLLAEQRTGRQLHPTGAFSMTDAGVGDLDGNVWEWTRDCYAGAGGVAADPDRCPAYVMGGEHEAVMAYLVRDPARGGCAVGAPPAHLGMRLVSEGRL